MKNELYQGKWYPAVENFLLDLSIPKVLVLIVFEYTRDRIEDFLFTISNQRNRFTWQIASVMRTNRIDFLQLHLPIRPSTVKLYTAVIKTRKFGSFKSILLESNQTELKQLQDKMCAYKVNGAPIDLISKVNRYKRKYLRSSK